MRWSADWQMKHYLSRFSCACMVRASSRKLGMNSPSSPSWVDSPPRRLFHGGREGCGFMEARFIARSLGRSPLMTNVRTDTFPLKAFVVGNVGFVFLYCFIHLVWGQLAMPGCPESRTCQISSLTPFKETSYWRDLNSASVIWPFQSLARLPTELPTLIMKSVASSGAPWRRFSTMFLCSQKVKEPQ